MAAVAAAAVDGATSAPAEGCEVGPKVVSGILGSGTLGAHAVGVVGALLDIPREDLPAYLAREARYEVVTVQVVIIDPAAPDFGERVDALVCVESTDEAYRSTKYRLPCSPSACGEHASPGHPGCSAGFDAARYHKEVGQFYDGRLWGRTDVLPIRPYLNLVMSAAREMSGEAFLNLLGATTIADKTALVGTYVAAHADRFPAHASHPFFVFLGVSTGHSAIHAVWPRWLEALGLPRSTVLGVDLPPVRPAADGPSVSAGAPAAGHSASCAPRPPHSHALPPRGGASSPGGSGAGAGRPSSASASAAASGAGAASTHHVAALYLPRLASILHAVVSLPRSLILGALITSHKLAAAHVARPALARVSQAVAWGGEVSVVSKSPTAALPSDHGAHEAASAPVWAEGHAPDAQALASALTEMLSPPVGDRARDDKATACAATRGEAADVGDECKAATGRTGAHPSVDGKREEVEEAKHGGGAAQSGAWHGGGKTPLATGDPIGRAASGPALPGDGGAGYWGCHPDAELVCFGCGGAGTALVLHLLTGLGVRPRGHDAPAGDTAEAAAASESKYGRDPADGGRGPYLPPRRRPRAIHMVDVSEAAVRRLEDRLSCIGCYTEVSDTVHLLTRPHDSEAAVAANDALVSGLPPYSVVVNATGMGKDIPGSPISPLALLPVGGVAWELNYRGERLFLRYCVRQQHQRQLTGVHDGWAAFVHGWSAVVELVHGVALRPDQRRLMADVACAATGRRRHAPYAFDVTAGRLGGGEVDNLK